MTFRRVLAVSGVLALALAIPSAHAAAPACRVLQDPSGDGKVEGQGTSIPSIDIVSADVASGSKNLVGVLRLSSLAADPMTSTGTLYTLGWSINGTPQIFGLTVFSDGSQSATFKPDNSRGANGPSLEADAKLDRSTGTITWTIQRKADPLLKLVPKAKPIKLAALNAAAQIATNVRAKGISFSGTFLNGDSANGGSYTDRAASCVKGT